MWSFVSVVKKISATIGECKKLCLHRPRSSFIFMTEKIPGLGPLIEKLMESIQGDTLFDFVYSVYADDTP